MRYVRRMICSTIVFTAANSVFLKEYLDTWVICIVFFGLAWIQIAPQWKRKDIPLKIGRAHV